MKAIFNGITIAESNDTIEIERNHYFPTESVNHDYLEDSLERTVCPWKGIASYYSVVVDGEKAKDAAWVYNDPKSQAQNIKGYIAFWKGVEVTA